MAFSFAMLALLVPLLLLIATVAIIFALIKRQRRKASQFGYPSLGAYLRAAPKTDEEKMDATDLALKGLVICFLGILFPPLLLVGLFPLFFGARKVIYASMGLGLIDDADQTGA